MNAEFNWWLLIVGLVVGAAIVYLVLADSTRREGEIDDAERPLEAAWLSAALRAEGRIVDPETAERMLELHRLYRGAPPPDDAEERFEGETSEGDASAETAPGERPVSAVRDDPDVERD